MLSGELTETQYAWPSSVYKNEKGAIVCPELSEDEPLQVTNVNTYHTDGVTYINGEACINSTRYRMAHLITAQLQIQSACTAWRIARIRTQLSRCTSTFPLFKSAVHSTRVAASTSWSVYCAHTCGHSVRSMLITLPLVQVRFTFWSVEGERVSRHGITDSNENEKSKPAAAVLALLANNNTDVSSAIGYSANT